MLRLAAILPAALALSSSAPAYANDFWPSEAGDEYAEAMSQADGLIERVLDGGGPLHRRLERILAIVEAYERAAAADPDAAEPHFRAAEVIYAFTIRDVEVPNPTHLHRAIRHYDEYERLAPLDSRLDSAIFRRSISRTKLGGEAAWRLAVVDYETLIGQVSGSEVADVPFGKTLSGYLAQLYSNAAEVLMGLGELDRAIAYYEASMDYTESPLVAMGLAVALDRDGQQVAAREAVRDHALKELDRILSDENVFFVPEGDKYYYYALGHEAFGRYAEAEEAYRAFLVALPGSRYADRAKKNLTAIRDKAAAQRREMRERRLRFDEDLRGVPWP